VEVCCWEGRVCGCVEGVYVCLAVLVGVEKYRKKGQERKIRIRSG
jgi:hypothetical protein